MWARSWCAAGEPPSTLLMERCFGWLVICLAAAAAAASDAAAFSTTTAAPPLVGPPQAIASVYAALFGSGAAEANRVHKVFPVLTFHLHHCELEDAHATHHCDGSATATPTATATATSTAVGGRRAGHSPLPATIR